MRSLLAEMTWPEVAQALARGISTVILPLGATEQHGPHLPLGTDTFCAMALAERLAEGLEALVAPALPVGCSDENSGFPGLLSLDHDTLARLIVDCARRMADWGVRRLVLLSAHGGNVQALALAGERLAQTLPQLQVFIIPDLIGLPDTVLAAAREDGIPPEAVGLHAGEGETSEMLYLYPERVRMARAAAGYTGAMAELLPRLQAHGLKPITPNGVLGDPSAAQAARGKRYLDAQLASYRVYLEKSILAPACEGDE